MEKKNLCIVDFRTIVILSILVKDKFSIEPGGQLICPLLGMTGPIKVTYF